jgi:thiamine biosynthesis protein ThiS
MIPIHINDQSRDVPDGASLADLLAELGTDPKYVAVEINGELVPRKEHPRRILAEGDRLEIVTLVGGG